MSSRGSTPGCHREVDNRAGSYPAYHAAFSQKGLLGRVLNDQIATGPAFRPGVQRGSERAVDTRKASQYLRYILAV